MTQMPPAASRNQPPPLKAIRSTIDRLANMRASGSACRLFLELLATQAIGESVAVLQPDLARRCNLAQSSISRALDDLEAADAIWRGSDLWGNLTVTIVSR